MSRTESDWARFLMLSELSPSDVVISSEAITIGELRARRLCRLNDVALKSIMQRTTVGVTALGVVLLVAAVRAFAEPLRFGPHDVASLFAISKSENKNEVVFAIHLDEHCVPLGDAPVFEFWRMYEKGPHILEPLLSREQEAYGIASERVLARGPDGGRVEVTLRALPKRPVVVETKPGDGHCQAWSTTSIAGESAYLYNVYVKLGILSVDYMLLSGWALDRTRVVHEKIER